MLSWRRFHLSYLITPRFSPACTGSVAVAALPVRDKVKPYNTTPPYTECTLGLNYTSGGGKVKTDSPQENKRTCDR